MSPYLKKDLPSSGSATPDPDVPVLTDRLGFPPLEFDTTVPMFDTVTSKADFVDLDQPSVQILPASATAPAVAPSPPPVTAPVRAAAPAPGAASLRTPPKVPDAFSETSVHDILDMASLGLPEKVAPPTTSLSIAPDRASASSAALGPEFEQQVIDDLRARLENQVIPMLQQQLAEKLQQALLSAIPASLAQFRTLAAAAIEDAVHRECQRLRRP